MYNIDSTQAEAVWLPVPLKDKMFIFVTSANTIGYSWQFTQFCQMIINLQFPVTQRSKTPASVMCDVYIRQK